MPKYIKLGEKAESFSSSTDSLYLVKGQVKELPKTFSKKIKDALRGGHIAYASELEFAKANGGTIQKPESEEKVVTKSKNQQKKEEKAKKLAELKEKLSGLDDDELVAYYKETYSVSDEDVASLEEMETEEKVDYLVSLED